MKLKRIQLNDSVFIPHFVFLFFSQFHQCANEWLDSISICLKIHQQNISISITSKHGRWLCSTQKLFERMKNSNKQNLWKHKKNAAEKFVWIIIITHTSPFREQSLVNFDSDAKATNRIREEKPFRLRLCVWLAALEWYVCVFGSFKFMMNVSQSCVVSWYSNDDDDDDD